MDRCGTCLHWKRVAKPTAELARALAEDSGLSVGQCTLLDAGMCEKLTVDPARFFCLYTTEAFGCLAHRARA